MGNIITDLKQVFKRGNIVTRLVFINAGVFVVTSLLSVFLVLFNRSAAPMLLFVELPASVGGFLHQPWSLITYMFIHAGVLHILFNMLWLYWFGTMSLYFFTGKHLRSIYVFGGICGGLLYILSYNIFPYFSEAAVHSSHIAGASASVLAIVTATAYREPNYPVRLLLIGVVRLKYLALFAVLADLLLLTSDNAGGHISHLGGALAGLWFAASLSKGTDITAWINIISDGIVRLFDRKSWRRKPKMKVHYGNGRTMREKDYDYNARKKAQADEIDRILDKLKRSGYGSLTTEEKKRLFDSSKR